MIAIPTYPYDPHSVWNRNQLGGLDNNMGTLIAAGIATYMLLKMMKGKRLLSF